MSFKNVLSRQSRRVGPVKTVQKTWSCQKPRCQKGAMSKPTHAELLLYVCGMLTAVTCRFCCCLCLTHASVSPRAAVSGGRGTSSSRSTPDCAVSSSTGVCVPVHVCAALPVSLSSTRPASVDRSFSPPRSALWALAQSPVRLILASPFPIMLAVQRFI